MVFLNFKLKECLGVLGRVYDAAQTTTGFRNTDPKRDIQGNFLYSGNGPGNLVRGHSVKSVSCLPLVSQEITSRKKTSSKYCRPMHATSAALDMATDKYLPLSPKFNVIE